jgi:serine/threonine protein kinase/TolB-like protein/tetratricopeptide (TPR) repeat protein
VQPGARLGPYEIVAPIGAGGMGEVYRARDTRLGRDVAIKVLPPEFADDPERLRRFEQEARAVAALSHPNVLALFDVGSAVVSLRGAEGPEAISAQTSGLPRPQSGLAVTEGEQVHFLVTELLEGESLRDRLRTGGLTVRKAVETAVQIAQGLAAAHEKSIVHRDLKPGNVFVTKDGQVKILDFGIAKLSQPRRGDKAAAGASTVAEATGPGAAIGTVGYMSPEQVRGLAVDHRTDIFAFGCVLHEMLSGRAPFLKETGADTVSAILHEDPPPLSGMGRAAAPALQAIVSRCLEKRPEDRFSSAHDLALALRAQTGVSEAPDAAPVGAPGLKWLSWRHTLVVTVGAVVLSAAGVLVLKLKPAGPSARVTGPPKIVVLPFENLGSQEDAYFAAGMTEEITSRLANVQGLGVISRTSAVEYNRKGKTVKQIGSDLGVDYVLEGSVRSDHSSGRESRVRITPQLIRVVDDTHVWADRYDRVIADVFAIQSEVAENTVKAMGVTLLPRERTALKAVSTNDLEAYDLYLRGKELAKVRPDRRHVEGALQMYQAAVDRDPRFAQALAALARSHVSMYFSYFDHTPDRLVKAKEAVERAVELRPDLAETHMALGWYYYQGRLDYQRALNEFAAALKIQPKSSDTLFGIGAVLRRQGHWAEAADEVGKALEFDPQNAALVRAFGQTCILARRYADADRACGLEIALSPQYGDIYARKAWLQVLWHGDMGKAQAVLDEAGKVAGLTDDPGGIAYTRLAISLFRRDYPRSLRQLEAGTRHAFDGQFSYLPIPLLRGQVQAMAGQHDLARRSFEAARVELEEKARLNPDDSRFHSSLGIAFAGLGRRLEAVREARLGCDLMPVSKDAWRGLMRVEDLAVVYTMVGRTSEAIAQLDDLLARSGSLTPYVLRLEPRWDPLRSDPRFQALLTKYEVKP